MLALTRRKYAPHNRIVINKNVLIDVIGFNNTQFDFCFEGSFYIPILPKGHHSPASGISPWTVRLSVGQSLRFHVEDSPVTPVDSYVTMHLLAATGKHNSQIKLGFEAPREIIIHRGEIQELIDAGQQAAA